MTANPWKDFTPGVYTQENYDKIDLHRPYVDDIILVSPSGKPMRRETDLIDVWFDSGAMPFAQLHYPFENKELLDSGRAFPADFIAEGSTRRVGGSSRSTLSLRWYVGRIATRPSSPTGSCSIRMATR